VRGRGGHLDQLEPGKLGGRQERVGGQRRGLRVALGVVDDLLEQRLRGTLGQAAVPLALGEQRVQHGARVVDGDQPPQHHPAGLGVHLDHGQVGAERERRARRAEDAVHEQGLPLRQLREAQRGVRRTPYRNPLPCGVEDDVVRLGLQQVGRALAGQLDQLPAGLLDGGAAVLQAARPGRPAADRDQVGVPVQHGDPLHRDAQLLADQHRPRGRVPLAVRGGPGEHGDAAVRVDLDGGVLVRSAGLHRRPGDLHVHRQPDPEWTTSPRCRRSACSRRSSAYPPASSTRSRAPG
jgi:hypothetical protein